MKNVKEVLIYAQLVLACERVNGTVLEDGAVEIYTDCLGIFSSTVNNAEKTLNAMRIILELYETLFLNDLSGLMAVADYNKDIDRSEYLYTVCAVFAYLVIPFIVSILVYLLLHKKQKTK